MRQIKNLYRWVCKRWGPRGLTLSAYAWIHAQETGNRFWWNRIDGIWLLFFSARGHCQQQYQMETRQS